MSWSAISENDLGVAVDAAAAEVTMVIVTRLSLDAGEAEAVWCAEPSEIYHDKVEEHPEPTVQAPPDGTDVIVPAWMLEGVDAAAVRLLGSRACMPCSMLLIVDEQAPSTTAEFP